MREFGRGLQILEQMRARDKHDEAILRRFQSWVLDANCASQGVLTFSELTPKAQERVLRARKAAQDQIDEMREF